jgi:4,5-dihydroxyphthalate decarboxylase
VEYEPPDVPIENAPEGARLEDLLTSKAVDAIVTTRRPPTPTGTVSPRRLFDDPFAVEADYFRRTSIFPIMHLVVIRRAVYEANPWLVANLTAAFEEAKSLAYRSLRESQPPVSLPWFANDLEREWQVFGGDPYPYGIEPNLPTLEASLRWSSDQGLSPRLATIDELFPVEAKDAFDFHDQR